jgi:hypothetical protein
MGTLNERKSEAKIDHGKKRWLWRKQHVLPAWMNESDARIESKVVQEGAAPVNFREVQYAGPGSRCHHHQWNEVDFVFIEDFAVSLLEESWRHDEQ